MHVSESDCLKEWIKQILIKNNWTPFWHLWASCFLLCNSTQQKNHKLCRDPSNEHSYQVWFQLAKWFQRRRLKCKSLRKTTIDTKWWQYLTWPFGSGELKTDAQDTISTKDQIQKQNERTKAWEYSCYMRIRVNGRL